MMLKDFRFGWRALVAEPAYSLVAILGLAIGVACALLLFAFVRHSWQYDAHVPDAAHVYLVKSRNNTELKAPWFDLAPLLLRAELATVPGVLGATSFIPSRPQTSPLTVNIGGRLSHLDSLTVMPGFVETMGVHALQGDLAGAMARPDSVALSEAAALRLFGSADVLGKTLVAEGKLLRVGAILRTPPANTTIPFEAIIGIDSLLVDKEIRDEMVSGKMGWIGKLLVRLHPDASPAAVSAALQRAADAAPGIQGVPPSMRERLGKRKVLDVVLAPLRGAYFDRDVTTSHITQAGPRADPAVVAGLGAIAVLILGLAAVNYVNLASVRIVRRQVDVAMRKVLGAGVRRIVLQLLAESTLVAGVATALGFVLAALALPLFSILVDRRLDSLLSIASVLPLSLIGVALAGLLGAVTAAYPAWLAAGVRPAQVLAGRTDTEPARGRQLRRVMTVMQVSTAMAFAGVAAAVAWQTDFAMRASPGFDPAPILIVDLPDGVKYSDKARAFVAALALQHGVAGVAISEDAVGRRNNAWSRDFKRPGGGTASLEMKTVSANFFSQYRLKAQAGRLFDPALDQEDATEPLVLNALSARELGFAMPAGALGQTVLLTGYDGKVVQKRVVGIAPELRFMSLREAPRAIAYELSTGGATLSVRTATSPVQVEAQVLALWPRYFPEAIPRMHRATDILAANYADDARMARLLAIATAIALAIAAFGTYVLSAHTVQRRAREIVLRKLYGARPADIALMVVREIGSLTLAAALVGLPLAAVAIERYLSAYVEHAPVGYWTLLLALAATLAVAFGAVARHAWLAMRMMPAAALRG